MNLLNRRHLLFVLAGLSLGGRSRAAQAPDEFDGFETLPLAMAQRDDGLVEVVEFFWYGCPHCYSLEPLMETWLAERKSEQVMFRREAPPLNPNWQLHSRVFYAAELMGVSEQLHVALFDAIHKDKRHLDDADSVAAFADSLGVDGAKLASTMKSFAVDGKIRGAMGLAAKYRLTGVPSLVVAGKYKTSASIAGGYAPMLDAVDALTAALSD